MERKRLDAEDLVARITWQALSKCLVGEMHVNAARETFFRTAKKEGPPCRTGDVIELSWPVG
ncbi:hypothetical protein USDA257_p02410 (plasmid) [Sinorhizobium fredii USDA 257]|uniref:Uncharacterized protein n=1 Tax=Sinorhizobium fredii (strain USDA 257) TaxID=1185652 RepID=I3XGF0_SINF2|nr:hypothetical protein USDA257_p02410 [Sinorhizobium fredii USDA 257]